MAHRGRIAPAMSGVAVNDDVPRSIFAGGRIPSLDGLRAISVIMVIIGHFASTMRPAGAFAPIIRVIGNGGLGVSVFFVISGFLITGLLIREDDKMGTINLPAFYARRTLRIWPAYFVLLAVVGALAFAGLVPTSLWDWTSAALFVWNFVGGRSDNWTLGHTWSLSVEEQFYLLWPACLTAFSRRTVIRVAIAIILLSPVLRVALYAFVPSFRPRTGVLILTRADTLMAGCLLALAFGSTTGREKIRRLATGWNSTAAFVIGAIVSPALSARFRGAFDLPFGLSVEAACIAVICAWAVLQHASPLGRLLNGRLLTAIGVRSYSLYLWQQLFVKGVPGLTGLPLPLRLLGLMLAAELSYRIVERPALRLKRFFGKLKDHGPGAEPAPVMDPLPG